MRRLELVHFLSLQLISIINLVTNSPPKGVSLEQDGRFANKTEADLKKMKFPVHLDKKVIQIN